MVVGLSHPGRTRRVERGRSALARRGLLTLPWGRVGRDPEEALRRGGAAGGLHASGVGAAGALSMLKRFAKTELARAVAADESLVVGKLVPWGLRVMDGETELSVTAVLDASAVGRSGDVSFAGLVSTAGSVAGSASADSLVLGLLEAGLEGGGLPKARLLRR